MNYKDCPFLHLHWQLVHPAGWEMQGLAASSTHHLPVTQLHTQQTQSVVQLCILAGKKKKKKERLCLQQLWGIISVYCAVPRRKNKVCFKVQDRRYWLHFTAYVPSQARAAVCRASYKHMIPATKRLPSKCGRQQVGASLIFFFNSSAKQYAFESK